MSSPHANRQTQARARRIGIAAALAALVLALCTLAGCASSSETTSSSSSSSQTASSKASSNASSEATSSNKPSTSASATSSNSKAPQQLQVPNMVSLDQSDAVKLLKQLGFKVWEIDKDYSDTVAAGHVILQRPDAGTMVEPATKVALVISQGKKAPSEVVVPNIVGMSQSEAEQALVNAKLVPVVSSPEVSTAVEAGKVCKQSIVAGVKVQEGSSVAFATALAEEAITVPNVEGATFADAKAALEGAGLGVDPSSAYSNTVAQDSVISQSVPAGTKVVKGTVVKLQVSMGPKAVDKVKVPYILTASLDEAIAALESADLDYRYSGDIQGTVTYVSPEPGTEVEVGSAVTFTLEHVATLIEVPDVKGKTGDEADAIFSKAGLMLDYDVRKPDRILAGTDPAAGMLVDVDDVVAAVYDDKSSSSSAQ